MSVRAKDTGIIILGHPRSGTTLLRRLLDGHSQIACPPETHLLSACARFLEAERTADGVDMGVLAGLNFAGSPDEVVLAKLREFAFSFLSDYAEGQGKPRWAEKTAFDAFHIDNIDRLCGEHALFVGIVRHGLDVAVSSKDFCEAAGMYPAVMHEYIRRYPQPIEAFARSWLEVNEKLVAFRERHPENTFLCRYEDLVNEPESTLQEVMEFVGERFEPAMLKRGLESPGQLGFGDHKSYQTREVHESSVARWRSLPASQIGSLAAFMNPMLEHFRYDALEVAEEVDPEKARDRFTKGLGMLAARDVPLKGTVNVRAANEVSRRRFYGREEMALSGSVQRLTRSLNEDDSRKIQDLYGDLSNADGFALSLYALLRHVSDDEDPGIDLVFQQSFDAGSGQADSVQEVLSVRLGIESGDTFADLHKKYQVVRQSSAGVDFQENQKASDVQINLGATQAVTPADDSFYALRVSVTYSEKSASFHLSFDFDQQVWPDAVERERAVDHYFELLNALLHGQDQFIDGVSLLTEREHQLFFPKENGVGENGSSLQRVTERFFEQVDRRPDHPAVLFEDEVLTYGELGQRVTRLSSFLRSRGVEAGSLVAVCVSRSLDTVTALLAVMHAGGAYVPIDPDHPEARINQILEDVDPPLLLSEEALKGKLGAMRQDRICCLDRDEWLVETKPSEAGEWDCGELAYVIFTSGSTGRPKGVEVRHQGLSAFLRAMAEQPGLDRSDRLLAVTTVSFDIAALEMFLPLVEGATVCLASRRDGLDGHALSDLIQRHRITVIQATPATFHILVAVGWQGSSDLKILCGGEALPKALAGALIERSGELWNMYGPTETTIWSLVKKIDSIERGITIGRPIQGTRTYILNDRFVPVPIGVPGELFIAGEGLARGYFGRPDLTTERFVRDPFSDDSESKMYRTGDEARLASNGEIEFLGRLDNQVKVRGFRIELGEVETAICGHKEVSQCVVGVYEPVADEKVLVAYVVQSKGASRIDITTMREYLASLLPAYMIPSAVVNLECLPLTPNNKVDRKALPKPSADDFSGQQEVAPASTPKELAIIENWERILGISPIGIDQSFAELGGDSLSFVQISVALEGDLGHVPDKWEEMPIKSLAGVESRNSVFARVDTAIFARAALIVLVVFVHSGLVGVKGITNGLFLVSGFAFANFQLKSIVQRKNISSVIQSVLKIVIPVFLFSSFLQLSSGEFSASALLNYSNFLGPHASRTDFWFIQVLVQLMLIMALILSFRRVREFASKSPFQFGVWLLALSVVLNFGISFWWDTSHLFNRLPHLKLWMFALGWCVYFADSVMRRGIVVGLIVILSIPVVFAVEPSVSATVTTALVALSLLFLSNVVVLVPLHRVVYALAGASLFIYITHPYFRIVMHRAFGLEGSGLLDATVGIVGGLVLWFVWETTVTFLNRFTFFRKIGLQSGGGAL